MDRYAEVCQRLLRHAAWADASVFNAVSRLDSPPRRLVELAGHLAATSQIYMHRLLGEDPFPQDFWPALGFETAGVIAAESVSRLLALVDAWGDEGIAEVVRYRTSGGAYCTSSRLDLMLHLALHAEHHRGQMQTLIASTGAITSRADFIVWTRDQAVDTD